MIYTLCSGAGPAFVCTPVYLGRSSGSAGVGCCCVEVGLGAPCGSLPNQGTAQLCDDAVRPPFALRRPCGR